MKKRKKISGIKKLDEWFQKNSIIYRIFKRIIRTPIGATVFICIGLFILFWFSFGFLNRNIVMKTLRVWERAIVQKDESKLMKCIDYSDENIYKYTFPDFKQLFNDEIYFKIDKVMDVSFSKHLSESEVTVIVKTFEKRRLSHIFKGRVLFRRDKRNPFNWKIIGMESIENED